MNILPLLPYFTIFKNHSHYISFLNFVALKHNILLNKSDFKTKNFYRFL